MVRLLAGLLVAAALALPARAAAPLYSVTWTAVIVEDHRYPLRQLTGFGRFFIWTYDKLLPNGQPPPLPQTLLYTLDVPLSCAGRLRCVLATLPLPDPDVLRRIIVSAPVSDDWPLDHAGVDLQASVIINTGPI